MPLALKNPCLLLLVQCEKHEKFSCFVVSFNQDTQVESVQREGLH